MNPDIAAGDCLHGNHWRQGPGVSRKLGFRPGVQEAGIPIHCISPSQMQGVSKSNLKNR